MAEKNEQLKKEGNAFYELDLNCIRKKNEQKKQNRKQVKNRQKPGR
ncbi:MAG: hypothetical protein Q4F24_12170 [Eubacteriales bacterium]|nr:hypothetical protein [Eubacteriales bacterium]